MASTATFVPVEVYLTSSYSPDCEYIDGEVLERNVGEIPHSSVQKYFVGVFLRNEKDWNVRVFPEGRVQVTETRYRVPDLCVVRRSTPLEEVIVTAPLLCIEVLSPEDRMSRMQERVDDYLAMGVQAVWVVDPRRRRVYIADRSRSMRDAGDLLTLESTRIEVRTVDIFEELDEMGALT